MDLANKSSLAPTVQVVLLSGASHSLHSSVGQTEKAAARVRGLAEESPMMSHLDSPIEWPCRPLVPCA